MSPSCDDVTWRLVGYGGLASRSLQHCTASVPVVEHCPHAELPSNGGIGRSETVPTTTGRTVCKRLSYMSGGRALQSLIHLRLTKAYAWCSGVHSLLLDRGLDCPWVAIPAPESDISDQVSSLLCAAGARWAVIAPKGLYDTASSEPTWAQMARALPRQGCRAAVMAVARQHFFILFAPYITACGLARRPPVHSLAQVLVFGKSHIYHDCVSVMNLIFNVPCLVHFSVIRWPSTTFSLRPLLL